MTELVPSDSLRAFLNRAASSYHSALTEDHPAAEYLMGPERGLAWQTIQEFKLGIVSDPLPGHEHVRGFISIPYLAPDGSAVSIRFRRLEGAGSKYLSMPGDPPRIFNTRVLDLGHLTGMCVTEGEFDAMMAQQCGLPAIGVPGANAWQTRWWRVLQQYNVVYVLRDDDDAGKELARKISENLDNAREVPMTKPSDNVKGDVTNFVLAYGSDALLRKVGIR